MAGQLKVNGVTLATEESGTVTLEAPQIKDSSNNVILDQSGTNPVLKNVEVVNNSSMMFRNRIINGGMQIAQRGTSHQHDIYGSGDLPYNLDRFCSGRTNITNAGNVIITQIAGGGQKHAIYQLTATLASDVFFTIRQHIEGFNCFDLAGKQVTVSFKVKTNKAGNYGVSFYDGTGSTGITPQSITVSSADASAENKVSYSKTFTMPSSITADNASRLRLDICLAAHSSREGEYYPTGGSQVNLFDSTSNYFEIYEIQLEEGTVATQFEHRPYGTELALCQRYYTEASPNFAFAYNSTQVTSQCVFNEMRSNPSASKKSGDGNIDPISGATISPSSVSDNFYVYDNKSVLINSYNFSGLTVNKVYWYGPSNLIVSLSAEL